MRSQVKHKYRKHRTLITVVAKKTLNVGETLRPDNTLAVCFTTCSRDIYQEILAGQCPTMDTKLQLRSIKVFVRSISEPKTVSLTSSTSVCKSDVGRTDIQRIGPKYPPQCCYSNCNETQNNSATEIAVQPRLMQRRMDATCKDSH